MASDPRRDARQFDEIDSALGQLARLRVIPRSYQQVTQRAGVQIDRAAAVLLARIDQSAPITSSQLAEAAGLDSSTVSRHVSHLQRDGLVDRRPHPDDARAVVLSLTRSGKRTLDRMLRARRSILEEALADWDPDDIEELQRLAARLADDYAAVVLDEVARP